MPESKPSLFYQKVYLVVRQIPSGQVTSYGRVARMLGADGAARQVGYAMANLKGREGPPFDNIPWQRVLGYDGKVVIKGSDHGRIRQAEILREEGIEIGVNLKVDMEKYLWEGLLPYEVDELLKDIE